jgi:hypothetical protein
LAGGEHPVVLLGRRCREHMHDLAEPTRVCTVLLPVLCAEREDVLKRHRVKVRADDLQVETDDRTGAGLRRLQVQQSDERLLDLQPIGGR